MGEIDEQIKTLQAKVKELEASQPTPFDPAAEGRWRDAMHQQAEARASAYNPFTRSQLEAMREACPDSVARDIVRDNRGGISPRGVLPSSGVSNARGPVVPPGGGTGWGRNVPLTNPPGTAYADKIMDAQDRRDRHELFAQEARRLNAEKPK